MFPIAFPYSLCHCERHLPSFSRLERCYCCFFVSYFYHQPFGFYLLLSFQISLCSLQRYFNILCFCFNAMVLLSRFSFLLLSWYKICNNNINLLVRNWLKEETLCLESFSGTCLSERWCGLLHPSYKGKPYLWQIHVPGKKIWDDLIESVNEKLEKSFRNPSFDGCRIG